MRRSPSLKHLLEDQDWLQDTWLDGLHIAQHDTSLHGLPRQPIWPVEAIRDPTFLPDAERRA